MLKSKVVFIQMTRGKFQKEGSKTMQYYSIRTPHTYPSQQQEKTKWLDVGTLKVQADGKMFIQLNQQPDVTYVAFPQKKAQVQPPEDD